MKKINVQGLLRRLLPAVAVIAVIVVFFVLFFVDNNKRVIEQNAEYVFDVAQRTAERVGSDLTTAAGTLIDIAALCEVPEENDGYPENLKPLLNSTFSNIDYVNKDGVIFRSTGDSRQGVQNQEYYVRGFEGHPGVYAAFREDILDTTSDERVLNFYTPVRKDGEIVGVLVGRYNEEKIRNMIVSTFFNEPSAVYLYRLEYEDDNADNELNDVKLIMSTEESETPDSIFSGLSEDKAEKLRRQIIDLRASDKLNGKQGCINLLRDTEHGKENICLTFVPGDNNVRPWLIVQSFPAAVTGKMIRVFNLEGMQLGLGLFFALALYICIILIINYFQNKKLLRDNIDKSYVVDGLTQLYDRFVYVNLDEQKYRYIANTLPDGASLAPEGEYNALVSHIIGRFKDGYDKKRLTKKLTIAEIRHDLSADVNELKYEYRTISGNSKWEDLSIICLSRNEEGRATAVLFARQNISDLKEKELQSQALLKEALSAAEDANRAKSDFLSNMSHDIRTPMNAVIGFSTLLERNADSPEKVKEYTRKIKASGQHLLGLINDVLDMSKIESGKITLNVSEFNMSELLDEVSSVISPQAKAKNQVFRMNTYALRHENYFGDKLRISQILINVLSNAVKYTGEGGEINFTIRPRDKVSDNFDSLVFTVKDNGIGMSEEFLKVVYEPFEREDTTLSSKIQGSGLGMAITKNLVDLMGGSIDVKSKLGEGTTFTINLELHFAEKTEDGEFWNEYGIKRVLVVDDEQDVCENVSELLKLSGVNVEYRLDGHSAYDEVKKSVADGNPYDVVLIDLKMPEIDGVETARLLRRELGSRASVLILTAYDWESVEIEAGNAGVDAFMAKPFFVSTFKQTLARVRRHMATVVETPREENDVLKGMKFLVAEDNDINAEIISELLEISGAKCTLAENGKVALEKFEKSLMGTYDMILMDIQMPVMNGYEATRAIRACRHPDAKKIPIAAMTANAFADDVKRALNSGMDAHIAKPVSMDVLRATIIKLKEKKQ